MDGVLVRRRPPLVVPALAAAGTIAAGVAVTAGAPDTLLLAAIAALAAGSLVLAGSLSWPTLLSALVLVIVFVPIRRYAFPGSLPIQLEPYRLLVALLLTAWVAALLADPRVRLRRSAFDGSLALICVVAVASVLANATRVAALQTEVLKSLSFLASFVLVFFLVVSVVRRRNEVEQVLKTLVSSMAVVGILAAVESRTGFTAFGHLDRFIPILQAGEELVRGSGTRARGPAEHPIALGAVLVLCVPLAFYLATSAASRRLWWSAALAALTMGTLATLSRTGILMLVVVGLVYLWLRPRETIRLWPLLLPALAAVHFALPGTLGSLKASFFPEGGLVAQQSNLAGDCVSGGRIADIGPALDELAPQPLLGIGYGTRITTGPDSNACILDSQWLGTLLEVGVLGFLAWVWLFTLFVRRLGRGARDRGPRGDLCAALAASVAAYAVSMTTYDAFSFVQVTVVLFLLLGLSASVVALSRAGAGSTSNGLQDVAAARQRS